MIFQNLSNFWKINTSSSGTQYYSIALTVNSEEQCSTSHSGSKAFPDVIPHPFDSEWRDLAIDTTIEVWNDLLVTQKFETKFDAKFENAIGGKILI